MTGSNRRADHGAFIVDRRGTILAFDQAMETLTGWPACDVVGRNKTLCRSASSEGQTKRSLEKVPLYEGAIPLIPRSRNIPLTLYCRDGRRIEVEALASRLEGPGDRILVSTLRILASSPGDPLRAPAVQLDPLTGLPQADAFAVKLAADFSRARESSRPVALVLADIDQLRSINDRWGREAGDEVLTKLAGILRVSVPDEHRIGRLDDDDFAILLPDSGRGRARQLAASLRSVVERYRFFESEPEGAPAVTLSLGAASFPADADSASDLMERARDALDEARSMGRNRVWCYLRRPRVPVEVPVFFDGTEQLLVGYTRDLSPSGIFVQTSVPIDIGMRCALAFPLPGREERVHVIGRIVRTVPPEFSFETQDLRIPGMGVEFERFGGTTDRRAIEAYLHDHESETLRPESGPLSCA